MSHESNPVLAALPNVLRAARLKAGLSQSALCERMGISEPNNISGWENGHRTPNCDTLLRFAEGTGIPLWKLIRQAERVAALQQQAPNGKVA